MTTQNAKQDLIILVADKDMEQTVTGVCLRPEALNVRGFTWQVLVHPGRDPGCLREGVDFLRPFQRQFAHALILFDRIGCGRETRSRTELEADIERMLSASGWGAHRAAVVLDPELEVWIWSDSPHVERVLGWQGRQPPLRQWLQDQRYLAPGALKPSQPKEAMEEALRIARLPRSSALYRQLAQQVSLSRCTDASFLKFKATLQNWFTE